jgi:predicted transporter
VIATLAGLVIAALLLLAGLLTATLLAGLLIATLLLLARLLVGILILAHSMYLQRCWLSETSERVSKISRHQNNAS